MTNKNQFKLEVDLNVINHLGVGLYSSTPAALTELVANAWDADATEVHITIDPGNQTIVIEDDGHGMDAKAVHEKFLNVGYSRRRQSSNKNLSDSGTRRVMGRKGIGKLSMFALADLVEVTSQAQGKEIVGFVVDVPTLKKSLELNHKSPELEEVTGDAFVKGQGTRIKLKKILTGLKTTESYLRTKLARRFSILGDSHNFKVYLNNVEITKADRNFYQHIQFLFGFDDATLQATQKLTKNLAQIPDTTSSTPKKTPCTKLLNGQVTCGSEVFTVTGYVASVYKPQNLGNKEDIANIFSVFEKGRVFAEKIIDEANSAK